MSGPEHVLVNCGASIYTKDISFLKNCKPHGNVEKILWLDVLNIISTKLTDRVVVFVELGYDILRSLRVLIKL